MFRIGFFPEFVQSNLNVTLNCVTLESWTDL